MSSRPLTAFELKRRELQNRRRSLAAKERLSRVTENESEVLTEVNVVSLQYNFEDMAGHTRYGKPQELKGGFLALSKKGTIRFTSYTDSSAGKENAD
jgi:hypothetical protein